MAIPTVIQRTPQTRPGYGDIAVVFPRPQTNIPAQPFVKPSEDKSRGRYFIVPLQKPAAGADFAPTPAALFVGRYYYYFSGLAARLVTSGAVPVRAFRVDRKDRTGTIYGGDLAIATQAATLTVLYRGQKSLSQQSVGNVIGVSIMEAPLIPGDTLLFVTNNIDVADQWDQGFLYFEREPIEEGVN
jgi:hypothetical protein